MSTSFNLNTDFVYTDAEETSVPTSEPEMEYVYGVASGEESSRLAIALSEVRDLMLPTMTMNVSKVSVDEVLYAMISQAGPGRFEDLKRAFSKVCATKEFAKGYAYVAPQDRVRVAVSIQSTDFATASGKNCRLGLALVASAITVERGLITLVIGKEKVGVPFDFGTMNPDEEDRDKIPTYAGGPLLLRHDPTGEKAVILATFADWNKNIRAGTAITSYNVTFPWRDLAAIIGKVKSHYGSGGDVKMIMNGLAETWLRGSPGMAPYDLVVAAIARKGEFQFEQKANKSGGTWKFTLEGEVDMSKMVAKMNRFHTILAECRGIRGTDNDEVERSLWNLVEGAPRKLLMNLAHQTLYDLLSDEKPPTLNVDGVDVLGFIGQVVNADVNKNVLYSMNAAGVAGLVAATNVLARDWPDFYNLTHYLTKDEKFLTVVEGKVPDVFQPTVKVCASIGLPLCKVNTPGGSLATVWLIKALQSGWRMLPGMNPHNGHVFLTYGIDGGMDAPAFWVYLHVISLINVLRTCAYLLPVIPVRKEFRKASRAIYNWMHSYWSLRAKLGDTQAYEDLGLASSLKRGSEGSTKVLEAMEE